MWGRIVEWAVSRPDAKAISAVSGDHLTYGGLARLVEERSIDLLSLGVTPSDRIAIAFPNGPHLATAFLASGRVACAAPLNPALTESEYRFYLGDLNARALLVATGDDSPSVSAAEALGVDVVRVEPTTSSGEFRFESARRGISQMPPVDPQDVALVLHTSGTTARPKMVPLSHRNLAVSAENVCGTLGLSPDDRCLNVMPLFHIHGIVAGLLATLHSGGEAICTTGFHGPSFFRWLQDLSPSWYTAVPTMHQSILERARAGGTPHHSLRFARSSSASLAPSTLADLERHLRIPVVEAYGMTEAAHQIASNPVASGSRKAGSVGLAAGPEVAIADSTGGWLEPGEIGEVMIRGENVTRGYVGHDSSQAFHSEGWFRTGDQGYLDSDGYLFLTGRLKEIINRGGETIAPRQIDEIMIQLDGVRQAVAFAVPDAALGEEVAAAVVLDPTSALTEDSIQERLMDLLAYAKVPKLIRIVDEIPKGPTGKLQRIGLAEKLGISSVRTHTTSDIKASDWVMESVARIWQSVLDLDRVGLDQPFLESGGDSLSATALVVAVEEEFDIDVPLVAFYNAATVRAQSRLIAELISGR